MFSLLQILSWCRQYYTKRACEKVFFFFFLVFFFFDDDDDSDDDERATSHRSGQVRAELNALKVDAKKVRTLSSLRARCSRMIWGFQISLF